MRRLFGLPLASCVVLLCLLGSCGGATTLEAGSIVEPARTADFAGVNAEVWLPTGRLDLVVTEAKTSADSKMVAGPDDVRPADGTELRGVAWRLNRGFAKPRQSVLPHQDESRVKQPVVSIVQDGHRTRLKAAKNSAWTGSAWVSVPTAEDFLVEVEFDGLTQSVDPETGKVKPSVASAYSRIPIESRNATCHDLEDDLADNYMHCFIDFESGLPYVPGVGWAPKGKEFVVVRVSTRASTLRDERKLTDKPGPVTVDGLAPVSVLEDEQSPEDEDGQRRRTLVFEVPDAVTHDFSVQVSFTSMGDASPISFTGKGTATLDEEVEL